MTEMDSEMSFQALRSEINTLLEGPQFEGIEQTLHFLREELQTAIQGALT